MDWRYRIAHIVRKSLFKLVNKDFLIFLFFLALSAVFWLLMTLNETYEKEVRIPVSIVNVPDNVVLISPSTDTMKVVVRDKGLVLLGYEYRDILRPLRINFKSYVRGTESASITSAELQRFIYQQLSASTKIVSIKPDKSEFFLITDCASVCLSDGAGMWFRSNFILFLTWIISQTVSMCMPQRRNWTV